MAHYRIIFVLQVIIAMILADAPHQPPNVPLDFFARYLPQTERDTHVHQSAHTFNANARRLITARQVRQRNTASRSTADAVAKQSAAQITLTGASARQIPQAPQVKRLAPAPPGIQSAVDGAPRRARQQPAVH